MDNDIDQNNQAGHLQADIDSSIVSVGVQGKYDFDIDGVTVTPHLGLRYHHLDVDSYTVHFSGGYDFDGKSFDANYVTSPKAKPDPPWPEYTVPATTSSSQRLTFGIAATPVQNCLTYFPPLL